MNSCMPIYGTSAAPAQAQYAQMYELGVRYRNRLLQIFRTNGEQRPPPSEHPTCFSLQFAREQIMEDTRTPQTASDALKHALVRDGYRCVLTGLYDCDSGEAHPELVDRAVASGLGLTTVDCAHIFPESAQIGEREALLEMFGLSDEAERLRNPHGLSNVMCLHEPLLRRFDLLDFWFEEVIGEPDTYDIQGVWLVWTMRPALPKRVRFEVDPEFAAACRAKDRPVPALPSPSLLAVRAVCSRVAHISGATDQANQGPP
ncbi:hypothetical protein C8R47DRAFT_1162715 [Mycena vitilis]|nr:hypothetical protein C8R47DRAFT_1162715 [Mycena vitilis]